MRTLTDEQREAKNARDRERRAEQKAARDAGLEPVRAARGERAPRGRKRAAVNVTKLTKDVASLLSMGSMTLAAMGVVPMEDALTPDEVELLAKGIAYELRDHPEWLEYLSKAAGGVSAHGALAAAVLAIALPRLARRNIVPANVAMPLTGIVYIVGGKIDGSAATAQNSVPMGRNGTSRTHRNDGEWQEHPSINTVAGPSLPADTED